MKKIDVLACAAPQLLLPVAPMERDAAGQTRAAWPPTVAGTEQILRTLCKNRPQPHGAKKYLSDGQPLHRNSLAVALRQPSATCHWAAAHATAMQSHSAVIGCSSRGSGATGRDGSLMRRSPKAECGECSLKQARAACVCSWDSLIVAMLV